MSITPAQYDAICGVIDRAKNDDSSLDTDEYASAILGALGVSLTGDPASTCKHGYAEPLECDPQGAIVYECYDCGETFLSRPTHPATERLTMSDYYSDLDRIKKAGYQHAIDHMANGTTEPVDGLFSGEWADGLTGQGAINYAGIKECTFSDLEDYEQADVMDSFEDGYNSAPWPDLEAERPADFDPAPDGWEDYALACDAVHAANPHQFEGEL